MVKAYLIQFSTTCIPTLIIEGIILLLFGFSIKKEWKVFLSTNIITQILLTATVGVAMIKGGSMAAVIVQIPCELIVLIGETVAYTKLLNGRSKLRRMFYGICANIVTWFISAYMIFYQFEFISKFL